MTWDKLIQRALVPFEGRAGQLDKRAGLYMDEAQEDFALHTKCFIKKTHMYITNNKTYIDLPTDFVEIADHPIFRGKCLTKSPSNSFNYSKNVDTNLFNTGSASDYFIENKRLYFLPRPSTAGILTLTYIASPISLRTSSGLKQLRFDNIVSEFFDVGDVIKSRVGGSNITNSQATVEKVEYEDTVSGILTLSTITNGFTNDNEDFFVSGPESAQYESTYGSNWESFKTTWNNLGFGGMAKTQGVQFDYTDTKPEIPDVYHYFLVDYVKAMINQDLGNSQEFQNHFSLYVANREKARATVANADHDRMSFVADRLSVGVL
tara:strand:- start:6228 stop:7187 length:960 start_codon:yes stop_codon:yes gene_type:complete